MNEPEKLFNRIKELSGCENKVALLQEIGRILLTEYVIKVENVIVEPIWIEAYYYDDSNGFKDPFVHRNIRQKEENVLYFHHKTDDQRNGVDICLSPENRDFYLSFLLKYTLVDGVLRSQSRLSPLIREKYKEGNHVLVHCDRPEGIIACTKRIGLKTNDRDPLKAEKEKYQNLELAIVRDFDKDFDKDFDAKIKLPRRKSLMNNYLLHTGCPDD